jgi:predicted nucleic acid-binding protein
MSKTRGWLPDLGYSGDPEVAPKFPTLTNVPSECTIVPHMNLVADTSILLSVLTSEPERSQILDLTKDADLVAPASLHWEVGNALSALIKRGRLTAAQAKAVIKSYEQIPIRFVEVGLPEAIELAAAQNMYAYDAYLVVCARQQRCKLMSLDKAFLRVAESVGVDVLEVPNP